MNVGLVAFSSSYIACQGVFYSEIIVRFILRVDRFLQTNCVIHLCSQFNYKEEGGLKKIISIGFGIGIFTVTLVCGANAGTIDLNTWAQAGTTSNGNWQVAPDGSSVLQTINGEPTYFVSGSSYINKEFQGSFGQVGSAGSWDNDYVGFVFGWTSINDYYLFDWKQGDQSYAWGQAYEGFTLSHISGGTATDDNLWDHNGSMVTVLDSDYNSSGWVDGVTYNFTLNYTSTGFSIDIDGNQIFAQSGAFDAGKFGFYNFSQEQVQYQGFEEETVPPIDPVPEPTTMLLFGTGLVGLIGLKRRKRK